MNITLHRLQESGLSTDWMTIKVGFEGIKFGWHGVRLRSEEVQEYAFYVLGDVASTVDEELVFLIADADLTDWAALDRTFALLANRSGVTRETAIRKWRYAEVKNMVADYQRHPSSKTDPWIEEELYSLLEFESDWNAVVSPPLPDAIVAEIEILIHWLAQEYEALLSTVPREAGG